LNWLKPLSHEVGTCGCGWDRIQVSRFGGRVTDVADGWVVGRLEAELRGDPAADVGVPLG
jgi:hypothetical protein